MAVAFELVARLQFLSFVVLSFFKMLVGVVERPILPQKCLGKTLSAAVQFAERLTNLAHDQRVGAAESVFVCLQKMAFGG